MNEPDREPEGFQVDERAAQAYEDGVVATLFAPWAERLIDAVGIGQGDRVLDVACGTGIVARRAARRTGDGLLVGVDINEGMLAVAERAAGEASIEWRRGDAHDLPLDGDRFDAVLCQQGLQFFGEPVAALAEMRRALEPDGRIGISVWRPIEYQHGNHVLAEVVERIGVPNVGDTVRSPYPDWTRNDLADLASEAGFSDEAITIEIDSERYPSIEAFVDLWLSATPLSELPDAEHRAIQRDVSRELAVEVADYVDDHGVVFPIEAHFLRASP